MFSRSSGYAIQSLTYLAEQPSGKLVGAREMAVKLGIPMPFLWKILHKLSEQKLVRSFKGVRGGYELARPAHAIHVSEVLAAGRERDHMTSCLLGLADCSDQDPCPLHSHWKRLRADIEGTLKNTSLADLAHASKPGRKKRAPARGATA